MDKTDLNNRISVPNVGQLANWLRSWVQPDGRIFGFHNHSVWGGNPYRVGDFSCDHATWASPMLPALAEALTRQPSERGRALLHQLIAYQTHSFQDDGTYKHVGFQVGYLATRGLIHNAITNCSLARTASIGETLLTDEERSWIRHAFERNIQCHQRVNPNGCCNQEYARLWSQLLIEQAFGDMGFGPRVIEDLDALAEQTHVPGVPDDECDGALRAAGNPRLLEPAEYYGLMIQPLVLAHETYDQPHLLDRAVRLARHVQRSAWTDSRGATRFHRLWYKPDAHWRKMTQPMLISGMGDTLHGISRCLDHHEDEHLRAFLNACDQTYATRQTPRGFFLPATGWHSEADVAPSSAWHSHDLAYLVHRLGVGGDFWDNVFDDGAPQRTCVVLGTQAIWIERGIQWAIDGYLWQSLYAVRGRKDQPRFGRQYAAFLDNSPRQNEALDFDDLPAFVRDDQTIRLWRGDASVIDVTNVADLPYEEPRAARSPA